MKENVAVQAHNKTSIAEKIATVLLIIAIVGVWVYNPSGGEDESDSIYKGPYEVVKVVDGDTIRLMIDGNSTPVRLIGIDTPESVHPDAEKNVPEGKLASEHTKELTEGHWVYVEYGTEPYDRYGRILAYVYLDEETMLNAQILEDGYAEVYTLKPNDKYEDYFLSLDEDARSKNAGLWSTGVFDD